jgi:branched-chain amino acid transport system permease protein
MTIATGGTGEAELVLPDGTAEQSDAPVAKVKKASTTQPTRMILPALVFGAGLLGLFGLPNHLVYAGSTALWYGLVGLGLYLPLVALRELPLNGAGLAGLAAYLFAYNASDGGVGKLVLSIVVAIAVTMGVSVLTGAATLVVTGLYFTVASLVVQIGLEKIVFGIPELTGGASGRGVDRPNLTGYFNTNRMVFLIAGSICLVLTVAVWYAKRTKYVPNWVMTGHQPEGAQAVGIRTWSQKLVIFAISGFLIGVAGCLAAFVNGTPPSVPQFLVIWSVILIALPIASGLRTVSALWTVAAVFTALPIVLSEHAINPNFLSGGILLIAIVVSQSQEKIVARVRRLREREVEEAVEEGVTKVSHVPEATARAASEINLTERKESRTLRGDGIVIQFGGVTAVAGVSVEVGAGQRVAIVGANGAGKTTLFNALTGFVPLTAGSVSLGGEDISGLPAYKRIRGGLGRTFQLPRLAEVLTVRQNVLAGQAQSADLKERAGWLMERFGIAPLADVPVAVVPFGTRRKVEMTRALARRPEVLLIDEPVSGLEDEEVSELLEVLLELQAVEGWGLLLIEHDLRFIKAMGEYLIVMENGIVIKEGPINEVLADESVRRIYLGEVVSA